MSKYKRQYSLIGDFIHYLMFYHIQSDHTKLTNSELKAILLETICHILHLTSSSLIVSLLLFISK